jgi:hypothetical protein
MKNYVLFKTEEQLRKEFICDKLNDGLHIHGFHCIITKNMLEKYFNGNPIYYKSKKLYEDIYYSDDEYTKYIMRLDDFKGFYMYDEWVESYIPNIYENIDKLFREPL